MKPLIAAWIALLAAPAITGPRQSAEVSNRTALIIGIGVDDRPEIPTLAGVKGDIEGALDGDNRIGAGGPMPQPEPDWAVKAAGPAGTDQLLVMVSDTPRMPDGLTLPEPTAAVPSTYALNTLGGRSALIDFLTGSGLDGKSASFDATLVSLKEVP